MKTCLLDNVRLSDFGFGVHLGNIRGIRGYNGILENIMEATILGLYWGYIGVILGLYWGYMEVIVG